MYVHDTNLGQYIQEQLASNILPFGIPIDTTQPNNPPGAERRRERRFVTNDPAIIHSLNSLSPDFTAVRGRRILSRPNFSGSGLGYLPTMCWASLSFSQMLSINSVSGSKSNGTFTVHVFV